MAIQKETQAVEAVLLVGHGRRASDTPKHLIEELRGIRAEERHQSKRYAELEHQIRNWPRTPKTDAYKFGLETILDALRDEMPHTRVELAFNEFCAPSIEEAVASMADDGVKSITVISTMFTPGGGHAEKDLPECIERLRAVHGNLELRYAWPFPTEAIAVFLSTSIQAIQLRDVSK